MKIANFERIAALLKKMPEYKDFSFFNGENPYEKLKDSPINLIVKIWGKREEENQVAFEFLLYNHVQENDIVRLLDEYIKEENFERQKQIMGIQPVQKMDDGYWKLKKVLFRMGQ
jgi:hypothetical protein